MGIVRSGRAWNGGSTGRSGGSLQRARWSEWHFGGVFAGVGLQS